jgi:hypothetical protein
MILGWKAIALSPLEHRRVFQNFGIILLAVILTTPTRTTINLFQDLLMSPEVTPVQPAVLLTIIGETVLQGSIVELLKSYSVKGYTIHQVQGEGGHGKRFGDIAGYNTNIEIKTIVSQEISHGILVALKEHQGKHALIAFRHDVEALY